MATPVVVGDLVLWDGGALFIGRTNHLIPSHSNQAIQVVFGYSGTVALKTAEDQEWTAYPLGIVASRLSHSMDATNTTYNAVIFVEPETIVGRDLTQRYLGRGVASVDCPDTQIICAELFAAWLGGTSKEQLVTDAMRIVTALAPDVSTAAETDHRILRAKEYIRSNLYRRVTLEDVAAHVFLSPSRFRHLFVEQTGLGLRSYVLWRRFIFAWVLLTQGQSVSSAAHSAGFADSAHFTRTSKTMLGFPPSLVQVVAGASTPPSPN